MLDIIVVQAVQRYAAEYTAENTVSIVSLPNDDMKGRLSVEKEEIIGLLR